MKHRSLATTSVTGLLYNWGFFTLLGYSPFLMGIDSPIELGLVFCCWGILVALFSESWSHCSRCSPHPAHPLRERRPDGAGSGRHRDLGRHTPAAVIGAVIVSAAFIGIDNTLITTAVMSIAPVERPVAAATYGFVRFIGGELDDVDPLPRAIAIGNAD